jgi:hypothetical protein
MRSAIWAIARSRALPGANPGWLNGFESSVALCIKGTQVHGDAPDGHHEFPIRLFGGEFVTQFFQFYDDRLDVVTSALHRFHGDLDRITVIDFVPHARAKRNQIVPHFPMLAVNIAL